MKSTKDITSELNAICGFECVAFCNYSDAFFATVPFHMAPLADKLILLFTASGYPSVALSENATGEALQVSAYA